MSDRRLAVFIGDNYYPEGGPDDFKGWAVNMSQVTGLLNEYRVDASGSWAAIANTDMKVVARWKGRPACLESGDEAWPWELVQ